MRENKKRLIQLDGMRIIMIFIIILSHFEFMERYTYGEFYWKYLHNATLGVDYFFMISGFGIMYSGKKPESINIKSSFRFAIDKVKKIYPIYIISLVISIPYSIINYVKYGNSIMMGMIRTVIDFIVCTTLTQSASGMYRFSHALNGVCWFLSTLFLSYLLCPLFVRLCDKLILSLKQSIIGLIVVILIILLLTGLFGMVDENVVVSGKVLFDDFVYGSPYIRCFYLLLGMIVAKSYSFLKESWTGSSVLEIGMSFVSLFYFFFRNSLEIPLTARRAIDVIVCISLLMVLALGKGMIVQALSKQKVVQLGKDSMYLFLLHYPVKLYFDLFFIKKKFIFGNSTGLVEAFLILFVTFIVVMIAKRAYEGKTAIKI